MSLSKRLGTEQVIRLIVTVFIVFVVSIIVAQLSVERIAVFLYGKGSTDFYAGLSRGTFELLDESIADQTIEDLRNTVLSLQDKFDSPISLHNRQQLSLPQSGLEILDNGEIYLHVDGKSSTVYRISEQTDGVWSVAMDVNDNDQNAAIATGPLSLIRDKFSGKDLSERSMVLDQLQQSYDAPLSIWKREELDFTAKELARLISRQVVARDTGDSGETYWIGLEQEELVFQAGPFDYPSILKYFNVLLLIAFFSVIVIGCLLWMWPLWRDLQRLRTAAIDIGGGKLETRVQTRKTSLVRSVLDGFNDMAIRTENMVASQRELTNSVSHELRTPLARMMFDIEMAKAPEHANDRARHLDSLEFNIGELKTLVDELLTYAKQERVQSPVELEELSIADMHNWLNAQVARAKRSRDNSCAIEVIIVSGHNESIAFSPQLMAHALSNALQNAMRFAELKIEVHLENQYDNWILCIEDDGPGIPLTDREHVFDPFYRLDESRQRNSGNFGLGLSIVRNIARWHQGEANIAPCRSLGGTRVLIQWPVIAHF